MLGKILRFGAVMSVPLAIAGAAVADDYQYRQQQEGFGLILYSGTHYSGKTREVFEPVFTLNEFYFNDDARSIGVISGVWEVCEHADFTGRCVLVRHDIPDLDWFGLDCELSSVRPVYEYTEAEHGLMFHRDKRGNIKYANSQYGHSNYTYGYSTTYTRDYYHYGHSPSYGSHGYYNPSYGYGPYGFAYTRYGLNPAYRNHYRARRHDRPLRGHYGAKNGAVTLHVHSDGRGPSLGLNRGVRDLSKFRFNDNVSSLTIRRGKWEVCEHANFRGRCRIIDASKDRLNRFRLNDNISSIRPVGDVPADARSGRRDRVGERRRDRPRAGDYSRRERNRDRILEGGAPRFQSPDQGERIRVTPSPRLRDDERRADRRQERIERRNQPRDLRRADITPPAVQAPRAERRQERRQERRAERREERRREQVQERNRLPDIPAMRSRQPESQVRPQRQQRIERQRSPQTATPPRQPTRPARAERQPTQRPARVERAERNFTRANRERSEAYRDMQRDAGDRNPRDQDQRANRN